MDNSISSLKDASNFLGIPFLFFNIVKNSGIIVDKVNPAAASLLGYEDDELIGKNFTDLFSTPEVSKKTDIRGFMNSWTFVDAIKKDNTLLPIGLNIVEYGSKSSTLVAIIRDRRESVKAEEEIDKALREANDQKAIAIAAKEEAIKAKEKMEESFLNQRKLSAQFELLKYVFNGILFMISTLSLLVLIGWFTGKFEKDSLAMFERILLVLTGMLGTAMAGVFDGKRNQEKP